MYALSIHSLICKGNVGKSISTASDDRNECKAHDSLPIRGEYRNFRKITFGWFWYDSCRGGSKAFMMCFVGATKKIQIQSVKFSRDLSTIYWPHNFRLWHSIVCKIHHPSVHDAMKMAAARPQSVFTADVYLSDNSNRAPTLAFARDVCITGWTTWEMGLGKKKGYVIYDDCVITTKEVRLCLCHLSWLGWPGE